MNRGRVRQFECQFWKRLKHLVSRCEFSKMAPLGDGVSNGGKSLSGSSLNSIQPICMKFIQDILPHLVYIFVKSQSFRLDSNRDMNF